MYRKARKIQKATASSTERFTMQTWRQSEHMSANLAWKPSPTVCRVVRTQWLTGFSTWVGYPRALPRQHGLLQNSPVPPRVKPRNYNRITNADNSGDDSRSRESQDRRSAERSRTSESDASRARKEGRNRGKRSRGRSRSRHEKKSPVLRRARRERQERSRREKDPKQEGVPEPEPTGKGDDSAPAKTKEEAGSSNREKAERRKETRKDRSGRKDKEKGGPLRIELPAFKEEKDKQKKGKARNAPAQTISRLKRRRKQHHRAVGLATSIVGVDCWAKIPLRNQVACQSRLPKSLKPQMVKRQHQVKERLQVGDKGRSSSLHPGAKCYDSRAAAAFPGSPALASYMSSNASLLNLSTEGLIMTRKTAVQSQGDLRRSGMPRADEQLKMLRDGILSGDLTRLEELVHVVDELKQKQIWTQERVANRLATSLLHSENVEEQLVRRPRTKSSLITKVSWELHCGHG